MAVSYSEDLNNNLTGLLARCYQEELSRYRGLVSLAEKVSGQIMASEMDAVTDNLSRQAILVDEIETVEKEASPLRREVAHKLGLTEISLPVLQRRSGQAALSDLRRIMEEMSETLRCLAQLQDANKSLLATRLDSVRDELGQLRRAKSATRAYFPIRDGSSEARFVDRKS